MKVVLDTNIWISGLLYPKRSAGKILKAWHDEKFTVVTSLPLVEEIRRTLSYRKIHKYLQWDEAVIDQYLLFLKFFTEQITLEGNQKVVVPRDGKDEPILMTFLQSQAHYLVTGDEDLLSLKDQYKIISLAEFCELLD